MYLIIHVSKGLKHKNKLKYKNEKSCEFNS